MFCKDSFKFYVFVFVLAFSVICAGRVCVDLSAPKSFSNLIQQFRIFSQENFSVSCFAQEITGSFSNEENSSSVHSAELPLKENGTQPNEGLIRNEEKKENASGSGDLAFPKEKLPKFRKVFVPEEIFSSIPTNGEAYWPINQNEFEKWLSAKESQASKNAPETEKIFAVSAVYHARLFDQQFLEGTAILQIQSLLSSMEFSDFKSDSERISGNFIWKISPFSFALKNFWQVQAAGEVEAEKISNRGKDVLPSAVSGRNAELEAENRTSRASNGSENVSRMRDFLISPTGTTLEFQAKDFRDGGQCRVEFPWSQRLTRKENSNLIFELEWTRSTDTQWILDLPPQWIPETKDGIVQLERKGLSFSESSGSVQDSRSAENPKESSAVPSAKDGEMRGSADSNGTENFSAPSSLKNSEKSQIPESSSQTKLPKKEPVSEADFPKEISANPDENANGKKEFSVSPTVSNPEWNRWRISFGGKTKAVLKLTLVNSPILMESPKSVSQKTIYQIRREGMDVFARMNIASLLDSTDSLTTPVRELCVKMEGTLVPISVRFNEDEVRWSCSSHPFSKKETFDSSSAGIPPAVPSADTDPAKTEEETSGKKTSAESAPAKSASGEMPLESQMSKSSPASVNGKSNSSDAVFLKIQLPAPLQGTSNRLEINAIGNLNSWLAEGSGELSPLPKIQLQNALCCENQTQVQVFSPLEILNFANEEASLTSSRQRMEQSHASLEFQEHSEESVISLALGRQTAHLSADQTTAVDFQEHEISAVTEILFSVDSGECFEILGIVDSSWTIDAVESSIDGLIEDWNLSLTPRSVHPVLSDFDPSGSLPEKLTSLGWNPDTLGVLKIQLNQSIRPNHPAALKIRARRLAYSNNFTFSGIQLAPVYFPHCKMGHSWLLCGSSSAWKIHFLEPYREQEIYWSNLSDIQRDSNGFKKLESSNSRKSNAGEPSDTSRKSAALGFKDSSVSNAGTGSVMSEVPQAAELLPNLGERVDERGTPLTVPSPERSPAPVLEGNSAPGSVPAGEGSSGLGQEPEIFSENERSSGESSSNRTNARSSEHEIWGGTPIENQSEDSFAIFPTLRDAQKHFSAETPYLTGIQDFKNVPMVRLEHSAQTFNAEIYGFYDIAKNPNASYQISCTPHGAEMDRIRIMIRPGILLGAVWKFPPHLQGTKTECLERSMIENLEDFNSSFELWELIFPQPQREPFTFEVSLMTLHSISGFSEEKHSESNSHLHNFNFLSERERLFEECLALSPEEQNDWWKKHFPNGLNLPLLDVPDALTCTGILALKNDIMDSIQTETSEMVPFLHWNDERIKDTLENPSKDVLLYRFSPHAISNSPAPTLKLNWRDGNPVFPQAWIWCGTIQSRCFANGVVWHSLTLDVENINSKNLSLKIKSASAHPCEFLDLEVNKQKLILGSALQSLTESGRAGKEKGEKKDAYGREHEKSEIPASEVAQTSLKNEILWNFLPETKNLETDGMVYHFEIPIPSRKRHNEITIQWVEHRPALGILASLEPPEISSNFQILQSSWKVWFPETFVPIRNFGSFGLADSVENFTDRTHSPEEFHKKKTSDTVIPPSALKRKDSKNCLLGKKEFDDSIFLRIFGVPGWGKNIFSSSGEVTSGEVKTVSVWDSSEITSDFGNLFLSVGWNFCESEVGKPIQLLYANSLEATRWFMLLLTAFLTSWLLKPYRIARVAICGISVTMCMLVPLIWTPFFSGIFLGIVLSFIGSSIRRHLSYTAEKARPLILVSGTQSSASSSNDETGIHGWGKANSKELPMQNSQTIASTKTKARFSQILRRNLGSGSSSRASQAELAKSKASKTEQTAKDEVFLPNSNRNVENISTKTSEDEIKIPNGLSNENFTRKVEENPPQKEQKPSNFRENHHE